MADHVDLILVFFDPIGAARRADGGVDTPGRDPNG